ncbi:MAG: SDR family NAD(P)-dependent oxidoreductase [Caldilineaceae bacterium]
MSTRPTILITGATAGIGRALAHFYHQQGACVLLIGRRPLNTLDASFCTPANYCQVDLAQSEAALRISSWLHEEKIGRLDLLIHNAGLGYVGALATQPPESIQQLLAVNVRAPIALTHALLPKVEAARGKLVFISSVATALPTPDYAVYTATKAALDGFVRNLQIELAATRSPVTAQLIHPGATQTGMHAKSGANLQQIGWEKFPTPETVAQAIAEAITADRRAVTIGWTNRLVQLAGTQLQTPLDQIMRQRVATRKNVETPQTSQKAGPNVRHCVITGAADGIGKALARQFAAAGYMITGIDLDAERAMRTQAELQNAGAAVRFALADLAKPSDLDKVLALLAERPPIDVMIHNAGINAVGPFVTSDLARQQQVLDVNLVAPLLLTAGLLNQARLVQGGSLVFLASLSHFVSYPGAAVYAASKDGLASYARSLAVALAAQKLHVLTVYPGPTRTEHARRYSPDNRREHRRMSPERLARQIFTATQRRQRILIPGLGNQAFALLGRFFPRWTEQVMSRTLFAPLSKRRDNST